MDIKAILEVGFAFDIQGKTNIKEEIREIKQELSQNNQNNQTVENQNCQSKLQVIEQSIRAKMEKIVMVFAKNANEKVRKIMLNGLKPNDNDNIIVKGFNNVSSLVVDKTTGLASKAFDITGFIVSRILYHLLFPRIETVVNEIQPTDIIKNA